MALFNPNFVPDCIPKRAGIYIVGGTVRDALLGCSPKDYDIVVFGDPDLLGQSIARSTGGKMVVIGKQTQCIYRVVAGQITYDIAQAAGKTISGDLKARDFTINAMAYDTLRDQIIDPCSGRKDIADGVVRMAGPAAFDKDPLRLLRAFRMAATLNFSIEPGTREAIRAAAPDIVRPAGERIRDEWLKLLDTKNACAIIRQMNDTGLLAAMFPEITPMKGCRQNRHHCYDVFFHSMEAMRLIEKMLSENFLPLFNDQPNQDLLHDRRRIPLIKHAALFHDIGKPARQSTGKKGRIHFYGHEKAGADMAAAIHRRLRLANRESRYIEWLIGQHMRPLFFFTAQRRGPLSRRAMTRFFRKTAPHSPELILFAAADRLAKANPEESTDFIAFARKLIHFYYSDFHPASRNPPLLTGNDLIRAGLAPSPLFGKILDRVETERLAGTIKTREEAIETVKKIRNEQNRT
ncbi:MAG: CCA tRNA nucleotidyltransferase [Thermodesulfobacteriota bacterium]